MKKIFLGLVISIATITASAQCNGEFSLSGSEAFQKFTNGSQIKMTYCGDKSNMHVVMNNAHAYGDIFKLEIDNDSKNEQLYHVLLTIKENNSGDYAIKALVSLGINEFYYNDKKIITLQAGSIFK
ncbi:MAG: hypothetical protein RLY35_824 [Bacteroidota bacterium]|jgi:hypothetical protein